MNLFKFFSISAIAFLSINAHALTEQWARYDLGGGSMYIDVDFGSITIDGPIRKARIKMGSKKSITPKSGEAFDFATAYTESNCETNERRTTDAHFFLHGEEIKTMRSSDDWRKASPTDKVHEDICNVIPQ